MNETDKIFYTSFAYLNLLIPIILLPFFFSCVTRYSNLIVVSFFLKKMNWIIVVLLILFELLFSQYGIFKLLGIGFIVSNLIITPYNKIKKELKYLTIINSDLALFWHYHGIFQDKQFKFFPNNWKKLKDIQFYLEIFRGLDNYMDDLLQKIRNYDNDLSVFKYFSDFETISNTIKLQRFQINQLVQNQNLFIKSPEKTILINNYRNVLKDFKDIESKIVKIPVLNNNCELTNLNFFR